MGTLLQDMNYGLRMLARNRGFTAVAVLTLALGVGANTAIFSVVNAALLRPLPYRDAGRLVVVWNQLKRLGLNQFPASLADYDDYKSSNRVFEDIAAIQPGFLDFTGRDQPERLYGIRASASLFPLLGVSAERGRTFSSEENQPGRGNTVLLSHAFWKRRFGGDPALVGNAVTLDGNPYTVVGILPPGFRFSIGSSETPDVWLPLALGPDPERQTGSLDLIARLKPGVSLAAAQTGMNTLADGLERQDHLYRGPHGEDAGYGVSVVPLHRQIFGGLRGALLLMLGAVGFVLLIACANVANLLLARGSARRQEIAVRAALGASRSRLAWQFLTEGLLLALFGTGVGLIFAEWGVTLLTFLSPRDTTRLLAVRLDPSVLLFAFGLAALTALIFGLVPALRASRVDVNSVLKEGGPNAGRASRNRLGSGLAVAEVALSLVLLAGAGLLVRSLMRLEKVNPGFNPENIVTARISLPASQYAAAGRVGGFYSQLIGGARRLDSVRSASLISALPLSGAASRVPFSIEGRPWQPHGASQVPQVADFQVVAEDYFRTLQIPLLEGRDFSPHDASDAPPVAVVNQTLVRGFWPAGDPIGQHIMMGAPRQGVPWLTIVGVAGDVRNSGLESAPIPQIYVPEQQHPVRTMTLVLKTSQASSEAIAGVRAIVRSLDRGRPVYAVSTLDSILSQSVASRRYNAMLLGLLALLAAALAAIGIYGVISYSVSRQLHEIGVRMALGAGRRDVLRLVLKEAMTLAAIGVAAGLAGALALTRLLSSFLFEVKPADPGTLALVSLVLLLAALLAGYIPARRAAKADPMAALRCQ